MPTELAEHQFEILPFDDAEAGVPFGIGCPVNLADAGFKPGGIEWLTEDSTNPINAATAFGVDRLAGPTWAWDLFVDEQNTVDALATMGAFERAWKMRHVRDEVSAVTAVRYRVGHRVRRIYGRPRNLAKTIDNGILNGYVPLSTDFKCADANTYSDIEDSVKLSLELEGTGGFVFPVVFPVTTKPAGLGGIQAAVGGDANTYPIIRFEGPITNPALECEDWGVNLKLELAEGDYIEIDTRPWVNTILLNGERSPGDVLGPRQWLPNMFFTPGTHDLSFYGSASSGGATCEVRWRSAWDSI